MKLLIDGYNLIHAANIVGRGRGPGYLERARLALLNTLAESLPADDLPLTTIVFDAAGAPPGLPASLSHRGLSVRFARGYENADEMIEELIEHESAPRRLTVVSSDHRVQRAARRRRATCIDSDAWYADLLAARRARHEPNRAAAEAAKPAAPLSASEVEFWLKKFSE